MTSDPRGGAPTSELTDAERTTILNRTATTLIPRLTVLAGKAGAAASAP